MEETTKREILRLRRQGATYPEIGNLVGYSVKSIQKVIGENAPELAKMKIPRISSDRKKAIARAYYGEKMTEKEVKAKYGVGGYTLNKIRLQFRDEYGGKKRNGAKTNFTAEQVAEIRADYESGMSVKELWHKWRVSRTQLRRYGILK